MVNHYIHIIIIICFKTIVLLPFFETCRLVTVDQLSFNSRGNTVGDLSDKAVDKTLNNKDFMKFAEDKKR